MTCDRVLRALLIAVPFAVAWPLAAQDSTAGRALPPIELHGLMQVQYRAGDPLTRDTYRLRRANLKLSGEVSPRFRWRIGFDVAKVLTINSTVAKAGDSSAIETATIDQRSRILLDAALTYTVNPDLKFDIGQQIVPLSLEGSIPASQIETIERANFIVERSRAVGLGDVRDIGVSANGSAGNLLEYHVGVFNEPGDAQSTTDTNDQKTLIGRLVLHASIMPNLQFGGSGAYEGGSILQHRERAGGEVQYRDSLFTLRGEAMAGRDGLLHRFGWYGLGALRPTPRLQLVTRYDAWDRDRLHESSIYDAFERQVVVGGTYLVDGPAVQFALNVVRQTFPNITSVRPGTFLLAAFQGAW